jgi:hypothetical protein
MRSSRWSARCANGRLVLVPAQVLAAGPKLAGRPARRYESAPVPHHPVPLVGSAGPHGYSGAQRRSLQHVLYPPHDDQQ